MAVVRRWLGDPLENSATSHQLGNALNTFPILVAAVQVWVVAFKLIWALKVIYQLTKANIYKGRHTQHTIQSPHFDLLN